MTDLEKFVDLYKALGIECVVVLDEKCNSAILLGDYENGYGDAKTVGTFSEKFTGYPGFYSQVLFDVDGNFISQSFTE